MKNAARFISVFLFFICFSLPTPIKAATITVLPGESIQSKCLSLANSGDTCEIMAGTFNERVSMSKSGITLKAKGKVNINAATITGNSNTLSGFTITDKSADAGIKVQSNNNLIENNEISHTRQDGIRFFGSNNVFRENFIHDILDPSVGGDPHADCFQTWGWNWETKNILFEKNTCDHTRTSGSNQILMLENRYSLPLKDITFRNNIFVMHDTGYSPLNFDRKDGQQEISGMLVFNNTFYNTTGTGKSAVRMTNISNSKVINNVSIGYDNLIQITGGSVMISNNIQSPPYGMVDYQNLNFHLSPGSPLTDKGINSGITDDYDGNPRPQGTGFDIGAFEYSSNPNGVKPGDANADGRVDGLDYVIWLNNYNQQTTGRGSGDFDINGKVDGVDYVIWLNNYNTNTQLPNPRVMIIPF